MHVFLFGTFYLTLAPSSGPLIWLILFLFWPLDSLASVRPALIIATAAFLSDTIERLLEGKCKLCIQILKKNNNNKLGKVTVKPGNVLFDLCVSFLIRCQEIIAMGQKLERLSEKDEESQDNSDWSEQTGDTRLSETAEPEDGKHPDDGSSASRWGIGGIRGFSASSQATGQPGKLTVTSARTDPQTEQPIRPMGQQEHLLNTRGEWVGRGKEGISRTLWEFKRVLSFKTKQISKERLSSEDRAVDWGGATAMGDRKNQNISTKDSKMDPKGLTASCNPSNEEDFVLLEKDEAWMSSQVESKSKKEVGKSDNSLGNKLPQPSRNSPQDRNNEAQHAESSDPVGACAKSSPRDCFKREMGQHLAEVTGSRCRLKEVSHVACSETTGTGRGTAETEGTIAARVKQEPTLTQSDPKDQQRLDPENKFAGVVSRRAKSGVSGFLSNAKQDDRQSRPPRNPSLAPQLQDGHSFVLEQCEDMPCPPLTGNTDGKVHVACLKKESELVCFSAVVTPPPSTHLLPKRDTAMAKVTSASSGSSDDLMLTEKPKVKGPPPPVPKKPKNPFIKLKTAQLKSNDVQRRDKDYPRSEERVKRRHTFHFNKDLPCSNPTNQDMCVLWDERGTYAMPANIRRLSADVTAWDRLSSRHIDDQYGDVVDFEYCERMADLSPGEEPRNLDMLQRRAFLDRRSKRKWSSPPVNTLASTETVPIPENAPDNESQSLTAALSDQKETSTGLLSEKVQIQVSKVNHSDYGRPKENTNHNQDAGRDSEVGSYKPVAKIVNETNQMQRQLSRVRPEAAKVPVRLAEQAQGVTVSQMKNTFDIPRKCKERPADVQPPPKKGKPSIWFCAFVKGDN